MVKDMKNLSMVTDGTKVEFEFLSLEDAYAFYLEAAKKTLEEIIERDKELLGLEVITVDE